MGAGLRKYLGTQFSIHRQPAVDLFTPRAAFLLNFRELRKNQKCLHIRGGEGKELGMYLNEIDFLSLTKEYPTPLYVYELDRVKYRYEQLVDLFSAQDIKVHYAIKANFNPYLVKFINSLGAGIDTVSPAEIKFAIKLGVKPEDIIFTANNLTNEEIKEAGEDGVLFNLGSTSELERYGQIFPGTKVCLRFNPDVIAGSHTKIQTGGPLSKFGILLDHVEQVKEICAKYDLSVIGIHKHTGSGIKDQSAYLQAVENLLGIITPENFPDIEFTDFGGGLFIPYSPDEVEYDYTSFAEAINERLANLHETYGKKLKLYFEPGKFLVAEAGNLLIQVNTIKDNNGHLIAGTNSGFNHLARPVMYDAYHHITNLSNPDGEKKNYDIVGNICETGDNFASGREMSEIREKDFLVIHNAGAYCFSMASIYNLRTLPTEICLLDGKVVNHKAAITNEVLIDALISA